MKTSSILSPARRALLAGLLAIFLVVDTAAMHTLFTTRFPGANDFYARWLPMRAWLLEGRSPYSESVTVEAQVGMYGRPALPHEDKALFSYPLYTVLIFGPFALVDSYDWASAMWLVVVQVSLLALIGLSLAWSGWRPSPALFGLTLGFGMLWYHAARTLVLGQFAALEAVLIVGALLALRTGRDGWAGLLLALSTFKPQMAFLLVPVLLAWAALQRRWRLPAACLGAWAALMGLSLLWLPSWLGEWWAQLGVYVENAFVPSPVAIVTAGAGPALEWALSGLLLAGLGWAWWRARGPMGRRFDWAVALTLVITNMLAVRTATTNYVMMTPALFLLFGYAEARWDGRGRALIVLAQAALFFGLWALFAATVQGDVEQAPMFLPLPFLLLAGLALVPQRWLEEA